MTDTLATAPAAAPAPDTRTAVQIEADIVATRERLSGRIEELQSYVAPKAVAGRGLLRVKRAYVDEFGGVRPDRVLLTVAVVGGLLALGALRRRGRR